MSLIAEEDFKIEAIEGSDKPARNAEELNWYYTSVRLTNSDELFCLCAVEKDMKSVILRHPIKVSMNKDKEDGYTLKWGEYNPFSDDEFTRFRVEQIHSINLLSDRFRLTYRIATKDKFDEDEETIKKEESISAATVIKESDESESEILIDSPTTKVVNKKLH